MFLKPEIRGRAPYGAFDLKINYQYNLLRAALIMAISAGAIVGALFVHSAFSDPVITVVTRTPIEGGGVERTHIKFRDRERRPAGGAEFRTTISGRAGIPVPVSIDELLDKSDSGETLGVGDIQVGGITFGGPGDGSLAGAGTGGSSRDGIVPDMAEFVPYEIPPRALEWALPEYPRLAKRAGLEGVVWVNAFVDENGEVQEVRIAKSSGTNAGFEEAAEKAAWECKFSPAIQSQRAIAVWVTFSYEFILSAE